MNSQRVFEVISTIEATSSKNEKQALIAANLQYPLFTRVLCAALNPLVSYGLSKRRVIEETGSYVFDDATWMLLDDLAARRLTGNNALEALQGEMERLEPKSGELLWRIIKKDLRAGFGAETVNKVAKGLIPTFPYMRCVLPADAKFDEWDWEAGAFSQQKADGMFTNVDHDYAGVVRLTTRQGNELPIAPFWSLEAGAQAQLPLGTQTHGEILVLVDGKIADRATGNGILNRVISGGIFTDRECPVFLAWDQIPLSAVKPKGEYKVPYSVRFGTLARQLEGSLGYIRLIPTEIVHSLKSAYAHCTSLQLEGKEGTVLKNGSGFWKDTKGGNKDVVKLKLEVDVDLISTAILDGEEGTKNQGRAGRVTMETCDGLLSVNVAVKNEKLRDAIDADPERFLGRIWSVRFNEITAPSESNPKHSLFLPRMAEDSYRTDKDVADSLNEVYVQRDAKVHGDLA